METNQQRRKLIRVGPKSRFAWLFRYILGLKWRNQPVSLIDLRGRAGLELARNDHKNDPKAEEPQNHSADYSECSVVPLPRVKHVGSESASDQGDAAPPTSC